LIDARFVAKTPEEVGIDSEKLERLFARAKRDVDEGVLPGCQVAVARNGRVAGMRNFGVAVQGGVEKPISDETLFAIFSCTKATVAVSIWQMLFEDGLLRLDEKVADHPEFGSNGGGCNWNKCCSIPPVSYLLRPCPMSERGAGGLRVPEA
jgi:CubicO group peptidase (beta-lactamase class C family)